MNQNSRLHALEQSTAPPSSAPPVLFLPDNGTGESEKVIRERWEKYQRTGESDRLVLIVPKGEAIPGTQPSTGDRT